MFEDKDDAAMLRDHLLLELGTPGVAVPNLAFDHSRR